MDTNQAKQNEYLDRINHAPYEVIVSILLMALFFMTVVLVIGIL